MDKTLVPGRVVEYMWGNAQYCSRVIVFLFGDDAILNDGGSVDQTCLVCRHTDKEKTFFEVDDTLCEVLESFGALSPRFEDIKTGDVLLLIGQDRVSATLFTVAMKDSVGKRLFSEDGEQIPLDVLVAKTGYNKKDFRLTDEGSLKVGRFFPQDI